MSSIPSISIIVPVYKAGKYLTECLDSILLQTFTDFELILVNDGSPDNSGEICDDYAHKDPRIKVIHKENGGAGTARKVGVDVACGRYIGWVDADDHISPDMFSKLYGLIEEYGADIAECQYIMVDSDKEIRSGNEEPVVSGDGDFILHEFFSARMKPAFWNKLYRPELLKNIEFPKRQIHVDLYISLQLVLKPLRYVRTSDTMYYYMVRENSNITSYNAKALREAIYKYEYTMHLSESVKPGIAREYLVKDAINRLMGRYFEVTVNSRLSSQKVYNCLIRRNLGFSLVKYLITSDLPLKTRVSYTLLILNFKEIQAFLHRKLGKK